MNCPCCKCDDQMKLSLSSECFSEEIGVCRNCNASWSVLHGSLKILNDPNEKTFLAVRNSRYFAA